MKAVRIIVFAKAPQAGFAKTRLIPALGALGAAELALQMLTNTLSAALSANIATVELCVTPNIEDAAWKNIALPSGVIITEQGVGDLGERMGCAAKRAIDNDEIALLIGTDCVEMSAQLLRDAAHATHRNDAFIHCTLDGGYALLGLKKFHPTLFASMPWSTDAVASTTLGRIGQLGWSVEIGQILHDVDEPEDLKYLPENWSVYA